jgi:hypothetical protein
MAGRIDVLLEQAQLLSPQERALLLDRLQDLFNPPDNGWDSAWAQECAKRIGALDRGEMAAEDLHEVLTRLREQYCGP